MVQEGQENLQKGIGADTFFINSLLVSPNRFRPFNEVNGMKTEHEHNVLYQKILKACLDIHDLYSRRCAAFLHVNPNKYSQQTPICDISVTDQTCILQASFLTFTSFLKPRIAAVYSYHWGVGESSAPDYIIPIYAHLAVLC